MKKTNMKYVGERYALIFLKLQAVSSKYLDLIRLRLVTLFIGIISFLKKLWTGYLDRQRYRKEVQRRLLKQRASKRERASTPLSLTGEHWTDRFLIRNAVNQVCGMAGIPFVFSPLNWKLVFPLVFLLGLLAYLPVMAKSDLDAELSLDADSIRPLKVGDRVPDLVFENLINYKTGSAKLSDFKDKLVILDFWATWCGACVSAFEKTDELQKEFGDQLLFLPVTNQKRNEVISFLNKLKQLKQLNLTSVVEDQTLNAYFPNQTLPYYVWIGPDGKVAAITDLKEVTKLNIQHLLDGKGIELNVKQDLSIPYDRNIPLFLHANGSDGSSLKYHSLFAAYTAGLPLQSSVKTEAVMGRKITGLNQPILNLYRLAYRDHGYITANRTILEVEHPEKLNTYKTGSDYLKWLEAGNGYCYELIVPPSLIEKSWSFMQQDLDRYFPTYQAGMQMRSTDCLVLKRTSDTDLIKSKGGTAVMEMTRLGAHIRNEPLSGWLFKMVALYFQNLNTPVFDETGYTGNIDLDIAAEMTDVAAVNKQLEKYGLQFVKATRAAEYLVIKDRK